MWSKNNEPLMASNRFTTIYDPVSGNIDVNINFVKPVDEGVYTCKAENIYGEDKTFVDIEILDVPNVDETPQTNNPNAFSLLDMSHLKPVTENPADQLLAPKVIIPLADTKIYEEKPVLLTCKIIGNPKPKVTLMWS